MLFFPLSIPCSNGFSFFFGRLLPVYWTNRSTQKHFIQSPWHQRIWNIIRSAICSKRRKKREQVEPTELNPTKKKTKKKEKKKLLRKLCLPSSTFLLLSNSGCVVPIYACITCVFPFKDVKHTQEKTFPIIWMHSRFTMWNLCAALGVRSKIMSYSASCRRQTNRGMRRPNETNTITFVLIQRYRIDTKDRVNDVWSVFLQEDLPILQTPESRVCVCVCIVGEFCLHERKYITLSTWDLFCHIVNGESLCDTKFILKLQLKDTEW